MNGASSRLHLVGTDKTSSCNKVVESLLGNIQSKQVLARAINNIRGAYPCKGKHLTEMYS